MTKRFLITGAMLAALTLMLSFAVIAQVPDSTAPAASSPQSPSQNQPATSPQDQDGTRNPSATPGQSTTQSAPAQAAEDNPLGLTEDQKAQLRPIVVEENQQMEAVRNDTSLSDQQKMAKINQIRETASPRIKSILTAQQLQKLAEMQRARQQQENQSAPQSNPQQPPR
jgi:hypothetical protein